MAYWKISVTFESLASQEAREPENAFPRDDLSETIAFICEAWSLIPEELQEMAQWTDTEIVVESDLIDAFDALLHHLVMKTSPVKIIVERTEQ